MTAAPREGLCTFCIINRLRHYRVADVFVPTGSACRVIRLSTLYVPQPQAEALGLHREFASSGGAREVCKPNAILDLRG